MEQKVTTGTILALTAREILLSLFDLSHGFGALFELRRPLRRKYQDYIKERIEHKRQFARMIYYLRNQKLIKTYYEGKEKFIELTDRGRQRIAKTVMRDEFEIKKPQKWDGKWRIVIFDIPEDLKKTRESIRKILKELGFYQLQKSVFIYPFDCIEEIKFIEQTFVIDQYVQFIIAERLETEADVLAYFIEKQIISPKMLK